MLALRTLLDDTLARLRGAESVSEPLTAAANELHSIRAKEQIPTIPDRLNVLHLPPMSADNSPKEYHDSMFLRLSYSFIKLTLGTLIRVLWVKKVEGIENIPKTGPIIVAFNHQSLLDFLCFISISPRQIHFLAADKFFTHPVWAPLLKLTSQIKVERNNHYQKDLHALVYEHLNHNKMIGIFPEGTRSPHEKEMLYAFTGVAMYAIRGKVPVLPVGIKGTYALMAKRDKRPKFKKIVTFHVGQPIYPAEYSHTQPSGDAFRSLTDQIMINISALSGKNYSHVGRDA